MKVNSWEQFFDALWLRKVSFLVTFFFVFLVTYAFLAWLDFIPELVIENKTEAEIASQEEVTSSIVSTSSEEVIEETAPIPEVVEPVIPDAIIIDTLDRTIPILNPTSRDVTDLDAALLYGVVRHPDSATLEQTGTVFILGHSSYLPTVLNKNFQAFNGIQNLHFGDLIRVQAKEEEYIYRVDRVYRANAKDITVPIAGDTKKLVLATCNSFGTVDDRYIVEADLLEVKTLAK